jgi:ABC-2 type transport system ATP-binding protein
MLCRDRASASYITETGLSTRQAAEVFTCGTVLCGIGQSDSVSKHHQHCKGNWRKRFWQPHSSSVPIAANAMALAHKPEIEPDQSAAISIRGLAKRYGRLTAVKGLDLVVNKGEIVGFLGLNGAGKTTTIRILLDLLRPSEGSASIFGHDCQSDGIRARSLTGYLPGEMGIYSDLTGAGALQFLGGLSRRPVDKRYQRELFERLELRDKDLNRKLREYSTGMKRKLGLIQAFQSDPPLLILDEPTEGLDPLMQESFYQLLTEVQRRGRTVFMSSHVLSEVERVCDRVALLRKGELVLLSEVDGIRRMGARRVRVYFTEDVRLADAFPPGHEAVEILPREWTLQVEGLLGSLMKMLAVLPVKDVEIQERRLEDVLIKYYREQAE